MSERLLQTCCIMPLSKLWLPAMQCDTCHKHTSLHEHCTIWWCCALSPNCNKAPGINTCLPLCLLPCSVISGAFFFIRSLLQFVNNEGWAAGLQNGWILTAFFFVDAYLLGESLGCSVQGCLQNGFCLFSVSMP